jgi:hypothetical protein
LKRSRRSKKPPIEEFDAKAAIALEWSEQIELSADPQKNKGRGSPKGTLSEGAKKIGINERRVFEVRQIREANPSLYQDVEADRRSLNSALAESQDEYALGLCCPEAR